MPMPIRSGAIATPRTSWESESSCHNLLWCRAKMVPYGHNMRIKLHHRNSIRVNDIVEVFGPGRPSRLSPQPGTQAPAHKAAKSYEKRQWTMEGRTGRCGPVHGQDTLRGGGWGPTGGRPVYF